MPVRVRPQADQAPSLSRYGLSRSPGDTALIIASPDGNAVLVKGLLSQDRAPCRGPVICVVRDYRQRG